MGIIQSFLKYYNELANQRLEQMLLFQVALLCYFKKVKINVFVTFAL